MKKSIFIVAIMGLMTFGVQAQVPDKVTKAFETKYKNAKELSWTSYGDEYYANFELNQQVKTATFMKDGQWATTVTVLLETKLPDCINDLVGKITLETKLPEQSLWKHLNLASIMSQSSQR